jgi:hypothetical protein
LGLKQLSRWEWEYGAAMSSFFAFPQSPGGHVRGLGYAPNVARALNAPIRFVVKGGKCGQKMKLIYALQVCGLGARVYKELIFGQLRICRT